MRPPASDGWRLDSGFSLDVGDLEVQSRMNFATAKSRGQTHMAATGPQVRSGALKSYFAEHQVFEVYPTGLRR